MIMTDWETQKNDLGFHIFEDFPFPPPTDGKENIILLIHNVADGVGDFFHGIEFGEMTKKITEQYGYHVCAIVQTDPGSGIVEERANFIQNRLESGKHPFYQYFLIKDGTRFNMEDHPDMMELLKKGACILEISYRFSAPIKKYIPKDVWQVSCEQFGNDHSYGQELTPFDRADMGLNITNPNCYGIPLVDMPSGEPLDLLFSIEDRKLLQVLCNKEAVLKEDINEYLHNRTFVPGYIQTTTAATAFIISNVLRYVENGKLIGNLDFFLPKGVVDEAIIAYFLNELGIDNADVQFVNNNSEVQSQSSSLRIFSGFYPSDKDYKKLYHLSNNVGGCSGDNSTALVISAKSLPYFQRRLAGSALGRFYDDLEKIVDVFLENHKHDVSMISPLNILKLYFHHLNTWYSLGTNQKITIPYDYDSDKSQGIKLIKYNKVAFLNWCKKTAELLSHPELVIAWQFIQKFIQNEYDYRTHYINILKGALYLSQPLSNSLKARFLESSNIQNLINNDILSTEDIDSLTTDQLLFLNHEKFNGLLMQYNISPMQLFSDMIKKSNQESSLNKEYWDFYAISDFVMDMREKYPLRSEKKRPKF